MEQEIVRVAAGDGCVVGEVGGERVGDGRDDLSVGVLGVGDSVDRELWFGVERM